MPVVIEDIGPAEDISEIRRLLDEWKLTFEAKDVTGIMGFYAPGDEIVTYDIMPPLEYAGWNVYRQSWDKFFGAMQGKPKLENRDVQVKCSSDIALRTE